jgi:hypothetical protein
LGNDFSQGTLFKGKIVQRRKLHASKEKGCQEKETLTEFAPTRKFRKASREEHLSGGFFIGPMGGLPGKNAFVKK